MSAVQSWVTPYIGLPWDPVTNHCWAFCRKVWRERFGWEVAELDVSALDPRRTRRQFEEHPEYARWTPVTDPREGDAVIMAQGARASHIGLWITPGRVLHSVRGIGSICVPVNRLRDQGYKIAGYYRRAI